MEQAQASDHTELSTVNEGCSRVLSAKPGIRSTATSGPKKAFHEDRARLKAERLERAASETGLKAKLKWMAA